MTSAPQRTSRCVFLAVALTCLSGVYCSAGATDFSVSPIRAELKPGAMSETITISNESTARLRVTVKLMEWTQDASGKDLYSDSGDLVYFPRQMDVAPGAKRLVRVGAKTPASSAERAYRLFIEEVPDATPSGVPAAVTFYFRFGVPIFLPPPLPRAQPDVMEPVLEKGKLSLIVRNTGNQHFRLNKLTVTGGAGYTQEIAGWYSLPGTSRTYAADIPAEACRSAGALAIKLEGEGISIDRRLDVDPARCS